MVYLSFFHFFFFMVYLNSKLERELFWSCTFSNTKLQTAQNPCPYRFPYKSPKPSHEKPLKHLLHQKWRTLGELKFSHSYSRVTFMKICNWKILLLHGSQPCTSSSVRSLNLGSVQLLIHCGEKHLTTNVACVHTSRETLLHVLNYCPVTLQQGWYTYRQNNVPSEMCSHLDKMLAESLKCKLFADLEGRHSLGFQHYSPPPFHLNLTL